MCKCLAVCLPGNCRRWEEQVLTFLHPCVVLVGGVVCQRWVKYRFQWVCSCAILCIFVTATIAVTFRWYSVTGVCNSGAEAYVVLLARSSFRLCECVLMISTLVDKQAYSIGRAESIPCWLIDHWIEKIQWFFRDCLENIEKSHVSYRIGHFCTSKWIWKITNIR